MWTIQDAWLARLALCRAILAPEFAISLMILDRSMTSVAMNPGKIVVSLSRTVILSHILCAFKEATVRFLTGPTVCV
jgi:hypothetical protein